MWTSFSFPGNHAVLLPHKLVFDSTSQTTDLLPVFFVLNGIHGAAWFSVQHEVKSSIFAEPTGVAQEGVFFVIVD